MVPGDAVGVDDNQQDLHGRDPFIRGGQDVANVVLEGFESLESFNLGLAVLHEVEVYVAFFVSLFHVNTGKILGTGQRLEFRSVGLFP